jgi:hypothetical protein
MPDIHRFAEGGAASVAFGEARGMHDRDLPRVLTPPAVTVLGLSESSVRTALKHERRQRLATGVLLTRPDEPTRDDWAMARLWMGGAHAVISGWDAVRLRGLARPGPVDGRHRHRAFVSIVGHRAVSGSRVDPATVVHARGLDRRGRRPRNRSGHLRKALESVASGSRSVAQMRAARRLRDAGLRPFEQNVPLLDRTMGPPRSGRWARSDGTQA